MEVQLTTVNKYLNSEERPWGGGGRGEGGAGHGILGNSVYFRKL